MSIFSLFYDYILLFVNCTQLTILIIGIILVKKVGMIVLQKIFQMKICTDNIIMIECKDLTIGIKTKSIIIYISFKF